MSRMANAIQEEKEGTAHLLVCDTSKHANSKPFAFEVNSEPTKGGSEREDAEMKKATYGIAALGITIAIAGVAPAMASAATTADQEEAQLREVLEKAIEAHKSTVTIPAEYNVTYETADNLLRLYYGNGIKGVASEKQTSLLLYANHWGVRLFPSWEWDDGRLTKVSITYKYGKAKIAKAQKKIATVAKKVKKIKGTTAKTKYVVKWTTKHLEYGGKNTGTIEAMNTGMAKCYGYALTTLDILRTAGVKDARYVICRTKSEGKMMNHAFCKIGKSYTDSCWCDDGSDTGDWRWFNRSRKWFNAHNHKF